MAQKDCFISYNSLDRDAVRVVVDHLEAAGISCWVDWQGLDPSDRARPVLTTGLQSTRTGIVVCGPHGEGPYQSEEIDVLLNQAVYQEKALFPLYLPGLGDAKGVNEFLRSRVPIDFRRGLAPDLVDSMVESLNKVLEKVTKPVLSVGDTASVLIPGHRTVQLSLTKAMPSVDASEVKPALVSLSSGLRDWPKTIGDQWMERPELETLLSTIQALDKSVTVLLGKPGSGKTALLSTLYARLADADVHVLGLKADQLPSDPEALNQALMLDGHGESSPELIIQALASEQPVVLIVDQLDAVADLATNDRTRINRLLDMIQRLSRWDRVHIVASSRPFEFAHDARLSQIDATRLELAPPEWKETLRLLESQGVKASAWASGAQKLMGVPQHLKTFLNLAASDVSEAPFRTPFALMEALWKKEVLPYPNRHAVIQRLAQRLGETEDLWAPAAVFDNDYEAVQALVAVDILMSDESGARLGFCHQSLFEFARARRFVAGDERIFEYALEHQQTLFGRPQVWATLTYMRQADPAAYRCELQALWQEQGLRFHLRRLLEEFLCGVDDPSPLERKLLLSCDLSVDDGRLLGLLNVTAWWLHVRGRFPAWMCGKDQAGLRVLLLSAIKRHPEEVSELMEAHWMAEQNRRSQAVHVLLYGNGWSDRTTEMLIRLVREEPVSWEFMDYQLDELAACSPNAVFRLLLAYLERSEQEIGDQQEKNSYESPLKALLNIEIREDKAVHEACRRDPVAVLDLILPWYCRVSDLVADKPLNRNDYAGEWSIYDEFRYDESRHGRAGLAWLLIEAFKVLVETDWAEASRRMRVIWSVELASVQRILCRVYVDVAKVDPEEALAFLVGDMRRLDLGEEFSDTKALMQALIGNLTVEQRAQLERAVLAYTRYRHVDPLAYPVETRRHWHEYNCNDRVQLLHSFPPELMTKEGLENRQVMERSYWDDPDSGDGYDRVRWRSAARMSRLQMEKAKDEHILRLLNLSAHREAQRDTEPERDLSRRLEWTKFAEHNPARSVRFLSALIEHTDQKAVANIVMGLGKSALPWNALCELIQGLITEGRLDSSSEFEVCHALDERLSKEHLLPEGLADTLRSWLSEGNDEQVQSQGVKVTDLKGAILFGLGGMRVLPHDNYPIMSLLTRHYLLPDAPRIGDWHGLLLEHLNRDKTATLWATMMDPWLQNLCLVEKPVGELFLHRLVEEVPGFLTDKGVLIGIANSFQWVSETMAWSLLDRVRGQPGEWANQVYGELLGIQWLWLTDHEETQARLEALFDGMAQGDLCGQRALKGVAYAMGHWWNSGEQSDALTELTLRLIRLENPQIDSALAHVLPSSKPSEWTAANRVILEELLTHHGVLREETPYRFGQIMEDFVPHSDELLVGRLALAYLDAIGEQATDASSGHGEAAHYLSPLAVTLQGLDDPEVREVGMTLFERLMQRAGSAVQGTLEELDQRSYQSM